MKVAGRLDRLPLGRFHYHLFPRCSRCASRSTSRSPRSPGTSPPPGSSRSSSAAASWRFGGASSAGDLVLWGCLVSFFNLGAWGVTCGYTPELYPTRLRGTGTGSAAAFGRIGGILAPLAVGWLLARGGSTGAGAPGGGFTAVFTLFAAVLLAGAAAVLVLGEETPLRR